MDTFPVRLDKGIRQTGKARDQSYQRFQPPRGLTPDEARYVTEMARRIAALLLLGPALDANYAAVQADTYPWPRRAD